MLNTDMRHYNYFTFGEINSYGQPQLSAEVKGQIKMAVNSISNSIADNLRYKDATYLGLTQSYIDDSFVLQYGEEKLKVLYVVTKGRYKQAFLKNI